MLGTKDYGLPQRRKRLYVCGVLKKIKNHTLCWPARRPRRSFKSMLDGRLSNGDVSRLRKWSKRQKQRVVECVKRIIDGGEGDPFNQHFIIDCDHGFDSAQHPRLDLCPTITKARGSARAFFHQSLAALVPQ